MRDQWRVRLLAGVTTLLWLGGILCVLYMVFWFNRFIIAYSPKGPNGKEQFFGEEFDSKMELHHSLEVCEAAVPALLLAALFSVWLIFSSRRATLNQINLSLAEISEQLREMRRHARRRVERNQASANPQANLANSCFSLALPVLGW